MVGNSRKTPLFFFYFFDYIDITVENTIHDSVLEIEAYDKLDYMTGGSNDEDKAK